MFWKSLVLALAALILFAAPAAAGDVLIGCEYDVVSEMWAWDLGFEQRVSDWLSCGTTLTCWLHPDTPYGVRDDIVAGGIPYLQGYDLWIQVNYNNFSARLSRWCNHYLAQSDIPAEYDTYGLTLRLELRL